MTKDVDGYESFNLSPQQTGYTTQWKQQLQKGYAADLQGLRFWSERQGQRRDYATSRKWREQMPPHEDGSLWIFEWHAAATLSVP